MRRTKSVAERVRSQVEKLGANGGIFTFKRVREMEGIRPSTADARAAGNAFYALEKAGLVEEVPGQNGRKRHKSYRLAGHGNGDSGEKHVMPGHEIDVDLSGGKTVTAWGHYWEVADGHLTVYRRASDENEGGVAVATFAPGAWNACVGESLLVTEGPWADPEVRALPLEERSR